MELKVGRIPPFNKADELTLLRLVKAWMEAEDDYTDGRGDLGTGKQGAARAASYKAQDAIKQFLNKKSKVANESVNEGKYDADLDKIEAAVKNALSFMNVGNELRKAGIKYDFSTSMIPMYMIKVSGTLIAIVNKKHANGPERVVNDIAIGVLN
jgi:hypothetical protein